MHKYKIYWFDTKTQQMTDVRIYLDSDATLKEALESAYRRFKIEHIASLERCRLVAYDSIEENIQCSLEGKEDDLVRDVLADLPLSSDLLLEIRDDDANFEVYLPDGVHIKVYTVDINTADIDGPLSMRVQKTTTIGKFKEILANKLGLDVNEILVAVLKYTSYASLLEINNATLLQEDVSLLKSTCIKILL